MGFPMLTGGELEEKERRKVASWKRENENF
jgi:hypothetical protein